MDDATKAKLAEIKEKLMPVIKHFGFLLVAMAVGGAITIADTYLVPALRTALPDSDVIVPIVTKGVGLAAFLYKRSPLAISKGTT